jgi:16S rRNA C967 or C1407 C5-methylase (RsmB/RsmF family)/NOL1/NOP2/fmu family ribosome biogenesis protein
MAELLGPETDDFLAALATPAAGLRVNTLRLAPERFREICPLELAPLPFPPEGFLVADDSRPGAHPYHAAGLYYLQDPGAMVVGALPELPPEARVLDLAAAPGGKATHLAARMAGSGVLIANDLHPGRAWELAGNLERIGARNAIVTADRPDRLADRWGAWFDLVLVDAPCSGESMFHKSDAARREWSLNSVLGCARRQGDLLRDAVRLVRPGGTLLYSTCTFAPEENEAVLAGLLAAEPELEMAVLPSIPGASPGRPDWAGPGADAEIARALRLWPHHLPGAGHFVAGLQRSGGSTRHRAAAAEEGSYGEALEGEPLRLFQEFSAESLHSLPLAGHRLTLEGEEVYAVPAGAPGLSEIRVLRPGWWLGTARKGRFEPSHSLAMALSPADVAEALVVDPGSDAASAYLRGEALRDAGTKGWVWIAVDGFPLGWGKRSDTTIKNHYPKGLRRR